MSEQDLSGNAAVLYLEDLATGQRYISGTYTVKADQILEFARQYDPQPFHTDPEAANTTFFQGLVASGWHTASITMRLLTESRMPIAGGLIGASAELVWPSPTRPGSVLRVESEVLEIRTSRSRPERGIVTMQSVTLDQNNEIKQKLVAKLIVPSRGNK